MDAHIGRRMWRGARIGVLAGITLAVVYIALGTRVNEFTELLGYSLVVVGFPALFAAIPVVQALGLRGGLGEYAALVSLTFPLNGILWGAILGILLSSPAAPDGRGD
ncbi:MAG TPA: hypothetical protein VHR41_06115 [Gemmatimonadales bacterium]|nr:hypothetical protein [Gemmatimonadales bacterium]